MKRRTVILMFLILLDRASFCQVTSPFNANKDTSVHKTIDLPVELPAIIVNGDTIPVVDLAGVVIVADRQFKSYHAALNYYMLKRDVQVAYPYALMAGATFRQCEEALKTMGDESDKKHYVKTVEKQLMKQYTAELKSLTVTQGKILIKLIDRETGNTSYEMVKELKGSFCAFMWQAVARIFGNNLKSEYDGLNEDREIENIIGLIDTGVI